MPYDAEFVFGGESYGETTAFTEMNASLSLYYNTTEGTLATFPSVYSFGSDTVEATTDLQTNSSEHGVHVYVGPLDLSRNFVYLTNNTNTTTVTTTTVPQTTVLTTVFNYTNSSTSIHTTSVPSNNTNNSTGGSNAAAYAVVGVVCAVVALYVLLKFIKPRAR